MTELSTQSLDLLSGNVGEESIRKLARSAAGLDKIEEALQSVFTAIRRVQSSDSADNSSIFKLLSTIYSICCEQARSNKPESSRTIALAFEALRIEVSIVHYECSKFEARVSSAISDWQRPMYEQISPVATEIHTAWHRMSQLREKNIQIKELGIKDGLAPKYFSEWIHPTFMAINKLALALWKQLPKNKCDERYIPDDDLGQSYKLVRSTWLLLTGQTQTESTTRKPGHS